MPTCVIDGKTVEFKDGENLVEVAAQAGITIPVYCYHPGLSVVAQCRMCMIEIDKVPKLQAACATPAKEGMVVHTKSEKAKKNRQAVMEFLLVNHPLDCPICDQSGECDLQDFSYYYGSPYQRTTEDRRTYVDLDMGPVIKKNMNRCIHCTRCIRFGAEIAKKREMVALQRGNSTEITTLDGRPLETDYAGNYADICPTGSLTLKDFRFKKRVWMLKKTSTICEGCSRGCNVELHQDGNIIYRCVPRTNMEINQYWICDEGRFNHHYVNDESRIVDPAIREGNDLQKCDWSTALSEVRADLFSKKTNLLLGTDLTQEELSLALQFAKTRMKDVEIFHFGNTGVLHAKEDGPIDSLLKMKSRTSNLKGAETLGIKPLGASVRSAECTVIIRGGRAELPKGLPTSGVIGVGVFFEEEKKNFRIILPGLSFAEKSGSVVNFQGKTQNFEKAIQPVGQSRGLDEILGDLIQTKSNSAEKTVQEEVRI